jgi:hypothetical protein
MRMSLYSPVGIDSLTSETKEVSLEINRLFDNLQKLENAVKILEPVINNNLPVKEANGQKEKALCEMAQKLNDINNRVQLVVDYIYGVQI